jgi:hypothetical protein
VTGEAAVVEVAPRRSLFVLINSSEQLFKAASGA